MIEWVLMLAVGTGNKTDPAAMQTAVVGGFTSRAACSAASDVIGKRLLQSIAFVTEAQKGGNPTTNSTGPAPAMTAACVEITK
jgi:hypothetical protein